MVGYTKVVLGVQELVPQQAAAMFEADFRTACLCCYTEVMQDV